MKQDIIQPMGVKSIHKIVFGLISNKDGNVLDAAAGQGYLSKKLAEAGFNVHPVDIDSSQFRYDKLKCLKVDLNKKLPFQNDYFDCVTSVETIEHLENPWHLIREFHRILKPNGQLIITTPNVANIFSRIFFLFRGRFPLFSKRDVKNKYHITPIPLYILEAILEREGFTIEAVTCSDGYIPILNKYFCTKNVLMGHILIISVRKLTDETVG